jgi:hypothetical protein
LVAWARILLPLFEAPKNLCWLGYVLTWLYNRIGAAIGRAVGPLGRLDRVVDRPATAVAAFAGIHYNEWSEANDILRC